MKLTAVTNGTKGDDDMNIRYLKLLGLVIPFFFLLEGCSFYARLGAVKQSEQVNAAVNTEEEGEISRLENGQNPVVLTNHR